MADAAFGTPGGVGYVDPFAPQPITPTAPVATVSSPTINPNQSFQTTVQAPTTQTTQPSQPIGQTQPTTQPSQPVGQTQPTTQPTAQVGQQLAVMPANGSIVDLLNGLGQDSSYSARTQLAQQFGVQGYAGTAAQNTDLAKKYIDFYNSKQGTQAPATNPMRDPQVMSQLQPQQQLPDPEKNFFDQYAAMNPAIKMLYDQINQALSPQTTQQTYVQEFQQLNQDSGLTADKLALMNINNIMDGTEDDIRTEVTKAGGFATDSQVQALTAARNKTLLKQANVLSQTIQAKQDYVNQIMQFTQMDRADAEKQVDRKINLAGQLVEMQDRINTAARENYQQIINKVGYGGLSTMLQGDARQTAQVEQLLGMAPGGLAKLAAQPDIDQQIKQAQLAKLNQDLSQQPKLDTQIVDVGGTKYLINTQTGQVIKTYAGTAPTSGGSFPSPQSKALAQGNISQIDQLVKDPALNGAVGPNFLARFAPLQSSTGAKSNFIAGIEQIRQSLTLTALQNAKQNGATFGALSDSEQQLLAASATKLGTWAIKKDGNVVGYNVDEASFKAELDKINNYAKLDYLLKGGSPADVGAIEQPDGTIWVQNSNGTYTELL